MKQAETAEIRQSHKGREDGRARQDHRTQLQKEVILQRLRRQGCRITKQRRLLLDIILEEDCSCCKEIYYKASRIDSSIGAATVYRMINILEDVGAISRKNRYRVACGCQGAEECDIAAECHAAEEYSGGEARHDARERHAAKERHGREVCRTDGEYSAAERCCVRDACTIEMEDDTVYHLSPRLWDSVIRAGLEACGYMAQGIRSVTVQPCE